MGSLNRTFESPETFLIRVGPLRSMTSDPSSHDTIYLSLSLREQFSVILHSCNMTMKPVRSFSDAQRFERSRLRCRPFCGSTEGVCRLHAYL